MRRMLITTLVLLAALVCSASPAIAEQAWWHLVSSTRPTYVHHFEHGSTKGQPGIDEVQEIVVSEDAVFELGAEGKKVNFFETGPVFEYGHHFPEATAANVQAELEKLYGVGAVVVTGGPEGVSPTVTRLVVKSMGVDAERPVAPLEILASETGSTTTEVKTPGQVGKAPHLNPDGVLVATLVNVGDANTSPENGKGEKTPLQVVDRLPAGVEAVEAVGGLVITGAARSKEPCALEKSGKVGEGPLVVCDLGETVVRPFDLIEIRIGVVVKSEAPEHGIDESEINELSVSGGGAPGATVRRPLKLSQEAPKLNVETYEVDAEEEGGRSDTQAGSHPFQVTFTTGISEDEQYRLPSNGLLAANPVGYIRDLHYNLPPGLIGNPQPFERCTSAQFLAFSNECPPGSVVGVTATTISDPGNLGLTTFVAPLFNLEPSEGEAAKFGFLPLSRETPVYIKGRVRTGSDYGITAEVTDIPQTVGFLSNVTTFWGTPGDARHNLSRDGCVEGGGLGSKYPPCNSSFSQNSPPPLFELPTSCPGERLRSSIEGDTWEYPAPLGGQLSEPLLNTEPLPEVDGCDKLPFDPSITVRPDVETASSASGLTVDVHVPQQESLVANGLGEADPRNITVALPAGIDINPSDASGLEACSSDPGALPFGALGSPGDQIGYKGSAVAELQPGVTLLSFSPRKPGSIPAIEAGETALEQPGINFCANASKIGTAKIHTPLLRGDIEGAVYLAPQEANPFGSLVAMYIVAEDRESGALVKLPGQVSLCQGAGEVVDGVTCQGLGQIVAEFENTPQAPFEDAVLHFFGGERSPLATPSHCGAYTTDAALVPWAAEPSDEAAVTAHVSSTFDITAGPNGGPCPGAQLPFHPSVTGGATNIQAGEFTPLTVTVNRSDGEQNLKSIEAKLPPGLSGVLTGVELCPEPRANEGLCGEHSLIGEATISVGVGGQPFTVHGGKFYLTGPYNGSGGCTVGEAGCAPFGLTFEVPAKAGPFDLEKTASRHPACDCVVVRGKIELNPVTSAITITSNPPGSPDSIPTSFEGIPLEIQHINATTTRDDFQFNPTNCAKMSLVGTVQLSEGGSATLTTPFQVTNCAALKFEPKFNVSTSGETSRAHGAGLTAEVTYPNVPQGTDADIARVKVELPKQLPSRLTTLQKACTAAQFEANPAACPATSKIGRAVVHTPLIPVPLEGPAIFVSHGNESFPSLTMVLQGYGITIDLVGSTFISKSGITSTTFKTVPDQPFSSFELTLPEGPYSALAAHGNLCKDNLKMPTEFVAQNGAEIHQTTKIAVTGCAKHKPAKHKQASKRTKHGKRKSA